MKIGYARVSTDTQNLDRQIDQLEKAGCEKIFQEKITGTKKDRPELLKIFEILRRDDILIISELTRLGRSTKDLIDISEKLRDIGVELVSIKENIDTTTSTGKLMFGLLAVLAEFERDLISERTKSGLESARARGRKGGRPRKNKEDIENAIKLYKGNKHSVKEIIKLTGVSKGSIYNYLKLEECK